jgi:type II secretory pathway component PulF
MTHTDKPAKRRRYFISQKDKGYFINNLALLLKADVPIGEAIESLAETGSSRSFHNALADIRHDIDEGAPLWKSLEHTGLVSRSTLVLIQLGENSGTLVDNLHKAARQEEKVRLYRAKVRAALLYPAIVLTMTFVAGLGVAWFLLPRLTETFSQLDVQLPLISRLLLDAGSFLRENGLWAVPLMAVVVVAICSLIVVIPATHRFGQRLQLHIPGVGQLLREIEVARFGYLLGTMLDAGLPVTEAMALVSDATKAPQYRQLYEHLHSRLEEGYSFKTALKDHGHANKLMPLAVQQMLIAGERSGALPATLLTIGEMYEEKSDLTTKNLEVIMEPVLLLVIGGAVLTLMLAVLVPIYGLVNQVGN